MTKTTVEYNKQLDNLYTVFITFDDGFGVVPNEYYEGWKFIKENSDKFLYEIADNFIRKDSNSIHLNNISEEFLLAIITRFR